MSNEAKLESSTEICKCFDVPVHKNKGKTTTTTKKEETTVNTFQ